MSRTPDISFCMIVRNGARTMPACLQSVSPVADELIVVDTGSTDDSRAVARSYGAKVLEVPWPHDFAAARNEYLKAARCQWVLSLDADEILDPVERQALQRLLISRGDSGFVFTIRNYFFVRAGAKPSRIELEGMALPGIGYTTSRTVRLLPRRPGLVYRYPVHESLIPALQEQRIPLRLSPIPIHHMGRLYEQHDQGAKAAAYRELGFKKIAQFPDYFLGHLELGQVLLRDGDLEQAQRLFEACVRLDPSYAKAYYYLALTCVRRHQYDPAVRALRHGLRISPRHPALRELRATVERTRAAASRQHRGWLRWWCRGDRTESQLPQ